MFSFCLLSVNILFIFIEEGVSVDHITDWKTPCRWFECLISVKESLFFSEVLNRRSLYMITWIIVHTFICMIIVFCVFFLIWTDMQAVHLTYNGRNSWVSLIHNKCLGRDNRCFVKQFIYYFAGIDILCWQICLVSSNGSLIKSLRTDFWHWTPWEWSR